MTTANPGNELLPHLFREEFAKMTAVLCRHFGLRHMETAEDIVSDTFLKASEIWAVHGLPQNPTAWLYTVAKNKAKDHCRRAGIFETQIKTALTAQETASEPTFEFNRQTISDSQLAMIFAVCNPGNPPEAQICLALQILCGFSVEEIANAFLTKTETIKKRLFRARASLRNDNFQLRALNEQEVKARLDTVLKTLYLLFNEGYFSKTGNRPIRRELCAEAMRLALLVTENTLTDTPSANALLALMCFQSSRFEARTGHNGEAILFEEQDSRLWNNFLIEKGTFYLANASRGNAVSKYHLEAGIAYWHTQPAHPDKWSHILQLYNRLLLLEYSPVTARNRTFAYAKVYGNNKAIPEAEKLPLAGNSNYHALLGYLYAQTDAGKAVYHYGQAIALSKSKTEKQTLGKEMARLCGETE